MRFAAKLSRSQHRRLDVVMGMQRELYNAGLEAWRTGYRMWQASPDPSRAKMRFSYFDNCKTLTGLRAEDPEWASLHANVARGTLKRLDRSIDGFYSSGRGYPRFKAANRWRSVTVHDADTGMLVRPRDDGKWWRLRVKGLPGLRFDGSRLDTPDCEVIELRVVRTALRTELHVVVKERVPEPDGMPANQVGMDAGIKQRFTMCDGTDVPRRHHKRNVIKRRQRAVSRAAKGSGGRKRKVVLLAKAHAREAERRRDEDFRIIASFIHKYDGFAVEDLRIANLMRNHRLADSIAQQSWADFMNRLQHRAERAGLRFCRVDPRFTSQTCSDCGQRLKDRLTLAERVLVCPDCGLVICRDVNAAINICDRGTALFLDELGWVEVPGGDHSPGVRRSSNTYINEHKTTHRAMQQQRSGRQRQPVRTKPHR